MENENTKVEKKRKGLIIGVIAAAAVLIAGGIVGWRFYSASAGDYVAKVGNMKVTKQEYMVLSKLSMNQFLSSNSQTTTDPSKYDWTTKVSGETAKDQVKKGTLESIQEIKIELMKAKDAGLTLSQDDLTNIDKTIQERITQSKSQQEAEKEVKSQYGVTLEEYKNVYKDLVLTQKYANQEREKIKVSDDELKKQYETNKASYEQATVTHILISTVDQNNKPLPEDKKKEAKQKAEDLLKQVQSGADIKELAQKFSQDPGVTSNKGVYTFSKGQMVPQFEEWAFSQHKPGDVGLVESTYGYHVMQFNDRVQQTFDQVKESIKTSTVDSKFYEQFSKEMDNFKKDPKYALVKNDKVLAQTDKTIYGV